MTKKINSNKLIIILLIFIIILQILILFSTTNPNKNLLENSSDLKINRVMVKETLANGSIIKRINYFINESKAYYPSECFWPDKICSDGIGCCRYFEEQDFKLVK